MKKILTWLPIFSGKNIYHRNISYSLNRNSNWLNLSEMDENHPILSKIVFTFLRLQSFLNCLSVVIDRLWGLHMFDKQKGIHVKKVKQLKRIEFSFIYSCIKTIEENQDFWIWNKFYNFILLMRHSNVETRYS